MKHPPSSMFEDDKLSCSACWAARLPLGVARIEFSVRTARGGVRRENPVGQPSRPLLSTRGSVGRARVRQEKTRMNRANSDAFRSELLVEA